MRITLRRGATLIAALALTVPAVTAIRSPSFRASFSAALRAFHDPSLVERPAPAPPPPPITCARFTEDQGRSLDDAIARDFDRPAAGDFDDDGTGTMKSLVMPDLKVPVTRRTMRYVRFFGRSEAGRSAFLERYRRSVRYREIIEHALREAGLPEDLQWVPAVESGFDPRAVSPAGAAGLWQFMPETGQLYGLAQSPWADERRHILRSTEAASTHLRDLYERLGRWDLALAAYNAGYDRIASALDKLARERGPARLDDRPLGFSDIAAAKLIPEETANYVPQIMAFAIIAANRSRFGLDGPELAGAPLDIGEIAVPEGTRLRTIARAAGVSIATLRDYNPQLLRGRIPPTGGDYLVALPASRVQHALATFPVYSEQEELGADADDAVADAQVSPLAQDVQGVAMEVGRDPDDPLPRRTGSLGKNRLPELILPGERRDLSPKFDTVGLSAMKLPVALSSLGVGWQAPRSWVGLGQDEDPFAIVSGRGGGANAKSIDPALAKQLAFLSDQKPVEPLRAFALTNGVMVRVRRDAGAKGTVVTVRIAAVEDQDDARSGNGKKIAAALGATELVTTLRVGKNEGAAAIELAAARVKLALGGIQKVELAELRHRAGLARRKSLEATPYGRSWLALGDALFPPDHPLSGTVLGAREDAGAAVDLLLADRLEAEQAKAKASITVVGDIDELETKRLAEAFLAGVDGGLMAVVPPHPRGDKLTVDEEAPAPRALVGWIGPGEGEVGDASLRVAIEILQHPKVARLSEVLGSSASFARAHIEPGPRASVVTVEMQPAEGVDPNDLVRRLDADLERLANDGPSGNEVAVAKFLLRIKMQKVVGEGSNQKPLLPKGARSATALELKRALRPGADERVLAAVDEVTVASVKAAVKRILAKDKRVLVLSVPKDARQKLASP